MKVVRKAFAYVTSASRLLLFTHPLSPQAGIQVPAGTMEPGERPADAALREAIEETGLLSLRVQRFIGRQIFDARTVGREEYNDRWFFHIVCKGDVSERWTHGEFSASDGSVGPIPYSGLPALIADHDRFIPELRRSMR